MMQFNDILTVGKAFEMNTLKSFFSLNRWLEKARFAYAINQNPKLKEAYFEQEDRPVHWFWLWFCSNGGLLFFIYMSLLLYPIFHSIYKIIVVELWQHSKNTVTSFFFTLSNRAELDFVLLIPFAFAMIVAYYVVTPRMHINQLFFNKIMDKIGDAKLKEDITRKACAISIDREFVTWQRLFTY